MARPRPRPAFIRRFVRARRGAVAVEFAFVAFPFLLLLFGIVELAVVFIASTTLEGATESAARKIRTGEFQTGAAVGKTDFRDLVCARMSWLQTDCATTLIVDVKTFAIDDFAGLSANSPQNTATFDPNKTCFSPGGPADIVLVRTYFPWRLFTPLLNGALQNMGSGSGKRLISAVATFRNEPYNNDPSVGAGC
ncbi:TadE/TadG family type IV pilus assembly protein [Phenylobacterium sp.]|jgi:Flp pilus assembly protein TadG|uniref:TadE/TadG family type IV pilus assembly protein n=1 Tax=Phenylobacterium sp. TaxID=1871053 RepID=UPI002F42CE27